MAVGACTSQPSPPRSAGGRCHVEAVRIISINGRSHRRPAPHGLGPLACPLDRRAVAPGGDNAAGALTHGGGHRVAAPVPDCPIGQAGLGQAPPAAPHLAVVHMPHPAGMGCSGRSAPHGGAVHLPSMHTKAGHLAQNEDVTAGSLFWQGLAPGLQAHRPSDEAACMAHKGGGRAAPPDSAGWAMGRWKGEVTPGSPDPTTHTRRPV